MASTWTLFQHHGQAPTDLRLLDYSEACLFCDSHLSGKRLAGNVQGRFGQQQLSAGPETSVNLAKQAGLIFCGSWTSRRSGLLMVNQADHHGQTCAAIAFSFTMPVE
jgi:hypothetical protein